MPAPTAAMTPGKAPLDANAPIGSRTTPSSPKPPHDESMCCPAFTVSTPPIKPGRS